MRKILAVTVLAIAAFAIMGAPAQAAKGPDHFYSVNAPNPCAAVCPYWTDTSAATQWDTSCLASPLTVPGSFHNHSITVPATDGGVIPKLLTWTVTPFIDYDIVICHVAADGSANGKNAGFSANQVDTPCNAGVPLIGCVEEISTPVSPAQKYILRGYNWSDVQPASAVYYYSG